MIKEEFVLTHLWKVSGLNIVLLAKLHSGDNYRPIYKKESRSRAIFFALRLRPTLYDDEVMGKRTLLQSGGRNTTPQKSSMKFNFQLSV